VQIFTTKEEEQALIPERNAVDWRRENRIPDSDDIQISDMANNLKKI
jgi:hypothetical protein